MQSGSQLSTHKIEQNHTYNCMGQSRKECYERRNEGTDYKSCTCRSESITRGTQRRGNNARRHRVVHRPDNTQASCNHIHQTRNPHTTAATLIGIGGCQHSSEGLRRTYIVNQQCHITEQECENYTTIELQLWDKQSTLRLGITGKNIPKTTIYNIVCHATYDQRRRNNQRLCHTS